MIRIIAVAGLAASFAAGAADIQKCADGNGRVTYQDFPCAHGSTIATLPRENASGDPVAIQRLEHERARLERAADAQTAQLRQQDTVPAQIQQQPLVIGTIGQQDGALVYYVAPLGANPGTGVIVGPTGAVQDVQGASATQAQQDLTQSAILQPPGQSPSTTTQAPPSATPSGARIAPVTATATNAVMPSPHGVMAVPGIEASPGTSAAPR